MTAVHRSYPGTRDGRGVARRGIDTGDYFSSATDPLRYLSVMKGLVAERYGGREVLAVVDRPVPTVNARDVLIAVKAASLNPLDFKIREGKVKLVLRLEPPVALGCDVAGVVERVGHEVTKFSAGDEVYARLEESRMGGLAERVAAVEDVVARKPARASFEEAAAIPLAGLTSLQALRESAGLTAGQR